MKRFTQFVCLILVVVTLLAVPANAVETVDQRGSNYFMKYSVYLWQTSGTKFEIWFDVTALRTMDELGVSKIELQRSSDQVNWTTVKTYEKEDYSQMVGEDEVAYANCVSYTYTSGYYYSAIITLYAKDGNSTAESTVATTIKYF